jgi:hypothetical protein
MCFAARARRGSSNNGSTGELRIPFLGYITRLDEAGNTLLVVSASQGGTAKIYKYALGIWNLAGSVPGPGGGINCNAIMLSGDGRTIARTCRWPQGTAMKLQLFTGNAWTMSEERPLTTHAPDYEIYEIAASYDAGIIAAAEFPTGNEADRFPSVHVIDWLRGTQDALTPYWPCLDQWQSAFGRTTAPPRASMATVPTIRRRWPAQSGSTEESLSC